MEKAFSSSDAFSIFENNNKPSLDEHFVKKDITLIEYFFQKNNTKNENRYCLLSYLRRKRSSSN